MGRFRTSMAAVGLGALALVATACPPPTPPAPTLPAGVGVQWVRDAGGTLDPAGYQADWQRFTVLDGRVSGPVATTEPDVVPATSWTALSGVVQLLPDGTAKFPWNGFAGDGVTDVVTPNGMWTDHTVTGPAGSCTFTSSINDLVMGIVPSPDGAKVAVLTRDADWIGGPSPTFVRLTALTPGCATLASVTHSTSTGGRVGSPAFVWAPDSSAVLYPLTGTTGNVTGRIVRLDATVGATPAIVLDEGAAGVVPLGWSTADRMLFARTSTPSGSPSQVTSTLETVGLDGSGRRVFDTVTLPEFGGGSLTPLVHFGYFVPGTTTVVHTDGADVRTNATGQAVPWFRIRLYDDTTGGKGPLLSADPPFDWHDEATGQVPNSEFLERFVR